MAKKRSIGITIAGILLIIIPLLHYIGNIDLDLIVKKITSNPLTLVIQLVMMAGGIGVLQLKEWARKLITYVALCFSVLGVGLIISFAPLPLINKIVLILYSLFYYFLTRPQVKEQFK